ncbi:MAG: DUF4011 domain-containing protein, partial [Kangiellaceae bacterium]|nr:DUF4011 domain-containing protein [Kangiellaceae bacterium]
MITNNDINLDAEVVTTFSLAAQQNAYPIIRSLSISHLASKINDDINEKVSPLKNIEIRLTSDANLFDTETWVVDQIEPGQRISLQKRELKVSYDYLESLTEEININLTFTIMHLGDEKEAISRKSYPIAFLPSNFWGGERRQPDLLAAFVKPNGVYVESLIKSVSDSLKAAGHSSSLDGYQSNTREHPYMMAAALWSIIFDQGLSYAEPPSSFAHSGQRIRLAADISNSGIAACLDTSLLFASALEAMGMNPVIALSTKHAFAGVWLIDERFPVLTNDDPMDLRKRVDMRDLILFETTLVTNDSPITFKQAQAHARKLIAEDNEEDFVYLIDIGQARARQIKPLGTFEEKKKETDATTGSGVALPVVPTLPPVRTDERVVDETPDTRIDTWQRKLLDLTKKNNLLNLSSRAVSIKIFCPDIAAMEDSLASGQKFKFLSAEKSPHNDSERDDRAFLLKTGDDIHLSYAREQLDKGILIANQTKKKLEQSSISLFRKAKNDLEEGGSNTLYIALGMLKWKDSPEDERSYRAPLILIPARFTRKSARAPIYVEQIPDEDPIFNLTLIEFLQTEHDIDLQQFRHELPEDESGVDVNGIWGIVREAIREQPGCEVVEELLIASFSFAKYLMWKDLKDRISDLKENPFVDHLVERPQDAYVQDSQFIATDDVDEKIDPDKIFTPLNCDSSQLIAVEASGHAQDFVLEGPPGTGKSETIANIICHNIALGRKVLFVAEKMAALSVVYRRMDKVG